jgi:hypothetical protein
VFLALIWSRPPGGSLHERCWNIVFNPTKDFTCEILLGQINRVQENETLLAEGVPVSPPVIPSEVESLP